MEFDFCLHLQPVNTGTKVGNKNQQIINNVSTKRVAITSYHTKNTDDSRNDAIS